MTSRTAWLSRLRRCWPFPGLGDARPSVHPFATYAWFDLDRQPVIRLGGGSAVELVLSHPPSADGLDDADAVRPADSDNLDRLLADRPVGPLPLTFERFIRDPEPRRRIRSVTACFLDLGESVVQVDAGGHLIHFLSDQQWIVHWLLFVPPEPGPAPVLATTTGYGFPDTLETPTVFTVDADHWTDLEARTVVCADSFDEFLARFLLENEAWRTVHGRRGGSPPSAEVEAYIAALRSEAQPPA